LDELQRQEGDVCDDDEDDTGTIGIEEKDKPLKERILNTKKMDRKELIENAIRHGVYQKGDTKDQMRWNLFEYFLRQCDQPEEYLTADCFVAERQHIDRKRKQSTYQKQMEENKKKIEAGEVEKRKISVVTEKLLHRKNHYRNGRTKVCTFVREVISAASVVIELLVWIGIKPNLATISVVKCIKSTRNELRRKVFRNRKFVDKTNRKRKTSVFNTMDPYFTKRLNQQEANEAIDKMSCYPALTKNDANGTSISLLK